MLLTYLLTLGQLANKMDLLERLMSYLVASETLSAVPVVGSPNE